LVFHPSKLEKLARVYNLDVKIEVMVNGTHGTHGTLIGLDRHVEDPSGNEKTANSLEENSDADISTAENCEESILNKAARRGPKPSIEESQASQASLYQTKSDDSITKEQDSSHKTVTAAVANTLTPIEPKYSKNKYDTSNGSISLSKVTIQQQSQSQSPKPEIKQKRNAGNIYWTNGKWYCKYCKFSGDKFDLQDHYCKSYKSSPEPEQDESKVQQGDGDSN
jgi:hypothetical protein